MLLRDWPSSRFGAGGTVFEAGRSADLQGTRKVKLTYVCSRPAPNAITVSVVATGRGPGRRFITAPSRILCRELKMYGFGHQREMISHFSGRTSTLFNPARRTMNVQCIGEVPIQIDISSHRYFARTSTALERFCKQWANDELSSIFHRLRLR
jgi:hypothetical protein